MEKASSEHLIHPGTARKSPGLGNGAACYSSRTAGVHTVQAKLETTTPGDAYEEEADRVADAVVSRAGAGAVAAGPAPSVSAYGGTHSGVPHNMESQLSAAQGGGMPMPAGLKSMMEQGFGRDLSSVRLHTDGSASGMSESINARAFTSGQDIYFNSGEYRPETTEGQRLIAHEITHTLQQGAGIARKKKNEAEEMDEEDLNTFAISDFQFWTELLHRLIYLETNKNISHSYLLHIFKAVEQADKEYFLTRPQAIRRYVSIYFPQFSDELTERIISYFSEDDWRFSMARRHTALMNAPVTARSPIKAGEEFSILSYGWKMDSGDNLIYPVEKQYFLYKAARNNEMKLEIPDFLVSSDTWTTIFGYEVAITASIFLGVIGVGTIATAAITFSAGTAKDLLALCVEYDTAKPEDKDKIKEQLAGKIAGIVASNAFGLVFQKIGIKIDALPVEDIAKKILSVIASLTQETINQGVQAVTTGDNSVGDLVKSGGNIVGGQVSSSQKPGLQNIGILIPVVVGAVVDAMSEDDEKKASPTIIENPIPITSGSMSYLQVLKSV